MRKFLTALLFLTITAHAQSSKVGNLVNQQQDNLIEIFKDIHQHPELAFLEIKTAKIVADELKRLGYEVIEKIATTGVVGILENGVGPVVMYRADMDANAVEEKTELEYASTKVNVMHACGHDAHITWLIGVARVMSAMKDDWSGTLVLVAQPAEETIEGARAMVEGGESEKGMYEKGVPKPDYLFGMHTAPLPTGTVNFEEGPRMAGTDQLDVTFHGVGGHGSSPHLAKDPVLMAASAVVQYQSIISRVIDPQHSAVLTVGSIQAGTDYNVIPNSASLKINLRWYDKLDRKLMKKGIERINKSIAMANDLDKLNYPEIEYQGWSEPLENDADMIKKIKPVVSDILGSESILEGYPPTMGSEDFHHLVIDNEKNKYLYMLFGTAKPEDVEAANDDGKDFPYFPHNNNYKVDLEAIPLGTKVASRVVLELFKSKIM